MVLHTMHMYVDLLQDEIKFTLKFFNLSWFSIFLCLPALIIHELRLEDKGNWESTYLSSDYENKAIHNVNP